jgi:hypothetical protein
LSSFGVVPSPRHDLVGPNQDHGRFVERQNLFAGLVHHFQIHAHGRGNAFKSAGVGTVGASGCAPRGGDGKSGTSDGSDTQMMRQILESLDKVLTLSLIHI